MQAPLYDKNILAAVVERELAAVSDGTFRGAFVLGDQSRRKIHPFQAREPETLQCDQTIAASTKKLNNFRIARPLPRAKAIEPADKLTYFLFRRFEPQVSGFPWIGSQRCLRFRFIMRVRHLCLGSGHP